MTKKAEYENPEMIIRDEIYDYIRFELLNIDETKSLNRYFMVKLNELRKGVYLGMKEFDVGVKTEYEYPYILATFKFCKKKILDAFIGKSFKNDSAKAIYALAIVKNNIDYVIDKILNSKKQIEKSEISVTPQLEDDMPEYKSKSQIDKKLKDLW